MSSTPLWATLVVGFSPVVAATVVLLGAVATLRQKNLTDVRDQWWKRVEWAATLVTSPGDSNRQGIGVATLTALVGDATSIDLRDADVLVAILETIDLSRFDTSVAP